MKVIKFGAIWCPACLIMRPRYNKVLNNYTDIESIEYDYDMDSDMVDKYKVGKILPEAIILDDNNNEQIRIIGEVKEEEILNIISKYRK